MLWLHSSLPWSTLKLSRFEKQSSWRASYALPYGKVCKSRHVRQRPNAGQDRLYQLPSQPGLHHFLHLQYDSWQWFLNNGLVDEFRFYRTMRFHLNSKESLELQFYPEKYRLMKPTRTPRQCIIQRRSYSSPLMIPIKLTHLPTNQSSLRWFWVATLPLLTKQGHFIIRGLPRVILNQVLRCPGVYFKQDRVKQKTVTTADFIAERGAWLRLGIDNRKHQVYAKVKNVPPMPVLTFLLCAGLPLYVIDQYIALFLCQHADSVQKWQIIKRKPPGLEQPFDLTLRRELLKRFALHVYKINSGLVQETEKPPDVLDLCRDFTPQPDLSTDDLRQFIQDQIEFYFMEQPNEDLPILDVMELCRPHLNVRRIYKRLFSRFLNPKFYNLSLHGRAQLNQQLGLTLPSTLTQLTPIDILFGCFYLLECVQNNLPVSDIDHLQNKHVKPFGRQLQDQMALGLRQLQVNINRRFETLPLNWRWLKKGTPPDRKQIRALRNLIQPKPINRAWTSFLSTNPLSQMLDQTNALAQITHTRRLSALGLGGVDRQTATMTIRGIHPSQYGRICPIETPEGKNAGLVNSPTTHATFDQGQIKTPYRQCYNGLILTEKPPRFFAAKDETVHIIAASDAERLRFGSLAHNQFDAVACVPTRTQSEFRRVLRHTVDLIGVTPRQMISAGTSLIPFLEHDDGNRALMGSNMQRQAVPTLQPQKPIVGTGFESRSVADAENNVEAMQSGFVAYVDSQIIILYTGSTFKTKNHKLEKANAGKLQKSLMQPQNLESQTPLPGMAKRNLRDMPWVKTKTDFGSMAWAFSHGKPVTWVTRQWLRSINTTCWQTFLNQRMDPAALSIGFNCFDLSKSKGVTPSLFSVHGRIQGALTLFHFNLWLSDQTQNFKAQKFKPKTTMQDVTYFVASSFGFWRLGTGLTFYLPLMQQNWFVTKTNVYFRTPWIQVQTPSWAQPGTHVPEVTKTTLQALTHKAKPPAFWQTLFHDKRKGQTAGHKTNTLALTMQPNTKWGHFSTFERFRTVSTSFQPGLTSQGETLTSSMQKPGLLQRYFQQSLATPDFSQPLVAKPTVYKPIGSSSFSKQKKAEAKCYALETFSRTNQDTYLLHRPNVNYGQWANHGDCLANNTSSVQGELAVGQNLLVGYTPWHGYNFEDAVLLSERTVSEDCLTSLHIERYKIIIKDSVNGSERITKYKLPSQLWDPSWHNLEPTGVVKTGAWIEPGDILVGKKVPVPHQASMDPYQILLYDVLNVNPTFFSTQETSARAPHDVRGRVIHVEQVSTAYKKKLARRRARLIKKGNTVHLKPSTFDSFYAGPSKKQAKKASPANIGSYKKHVADTKNQRRLLLRRAKLNQTLRVSFKSTWDHVLTQMAMPNTFFGNFVDILALTWPTTFFRGHLENIQNKQKEKAFWRQSAKASEKSKATKFRPLAYGLRRNPVFVGQQRLGLTPKSWVCGENNFYTSENKKQASWMTPAKPEAIRPKAGPPPDYVGQVFVYIASQRRVEVGDKLSGRHGNKGIISRILPREDMPYLPDGTPLDLVLNPLGVPSRMNVGQIFECLLGLAGSYLHQTFKIQPFDEIYGSQTSRSLVYNKLYEARLKTQQNWLFDPNFPGKVRLFDGLNGQCFDQPVTVGKAYILKLIHMVHEKIHARNTGPYSLVTQQPLRGRSKKGGQRLGEMEVWALEAFGAIFALQELLTFKSDDMEGRRQVLDCIAENKPFQFATPEAFKVLILELRSLTLDLVLYGLGGNSTLNVLSVKPEPTKTFGVQSESDESDIPQEVFNG